MDDPDSQVFFDDFLDDFFAESDEHLTIVRRDLIALEADSGADGIDASLLEELFRRFHTLKGLCGMVGLKVAEVLAHQMESYLRALRHDPHLLSSEGTEALIEGTQALEMIIGAKRDKSSSPDITAISNRFDGLIPANLKMDVPLPEPPSESPSSDLKKETTAQLRDALRVGGRAWQFEFQPSAERSGRGVDVNSIRQRLEGVGKLVHSAPTISKEGEVLFRFLVVSEEDEKVFETWAQDGLTHTPYQVETALERVVEKDETTEVAKKAPTPGSVKPSNIVRVDLSRIEDLMQQVGDLVISRSRLEDRVTHLEKMLPASETRTLQEIHTVMERQIRDLREGVMGLRLVPVANVFTRMQFVIRDLAVESRKKVSLAMTGQDTEIDKFVVERMLDPLLHLVRNAVTHGLEPGEERVKKGKPEQGNIYLRAFTEGDAVVIEVEDDGRGIQVEEVVRRAKEKDLIDEDAVLDMTAILDILCTPAFSTQDEADLGSGRGVGLAVVKNRIEELGGVLHMDTGPDQGTCFTMTLPLTLSIVDALIVSVGEQVLAVPKPSAREVIEFEPSAISIMENNEMIPYRDGVLPLFHLGPFFGIKERPRQVLYALVIGQGGGLLGVVVDRVVTIKEIVVHTVSDSLVKVPGILGATELGDRRAVLILDTADLIRVARSGISDFRSQIELDCRF